MRHWRYLLALSLIIIAVLVFFSRFSSWREIPAVFQEAHKKPLWFLLFLEVFSLLIYGLLSQTLLKIGGNNVSLKETVTVGLLMILGFQVAPFVGGAVLVYLFYRQLKLPSSSIVFLVTLLTVLNFLNSFLFAFLSALLLPNSFSTVLPERAVLSLLFTLLAFFLAAFVLLRQGAKNLTRFLHFLSRPLNALGWRLFKRPLLGPEKTARVIQEALRDLDLLLKHPFKTLQALLLSVLFYLVNLTTLYFSFYVFGFQANISLLVLGFTASSILSLLSFFPEMPGVMEASLITVFVSLGFPAHVTLLAALLYRLVTYWLPLPLGFFVFYKNGIHRSLAGAAS